MDFLGVLKILFEQSKNNNHIRDLGEQLNAKEEQINNLKKEENELKRQCELAYMELYSITQIAQQVAYKFNYQLVLEDRLKELYLKSLQLGYTLQRVPWHKILKYDELKQMEDKRALEENRKIVEELNSRLANRHIVKRMRALQERRNKLNAILEDASNILDSERKRNQLRIEEAVQKRNQYILSLVKGSKELQDLRKKITLKNSDVVPIEIESNMIEANPSPSQQTLLLPPNELNIPKKDFGIEATKKLAFVTEKFDFEKFCQLKISHDFVELSNTGTSLRSILRGPVMAKEPNIPNDSKLDKHVVIVTPEDDDDKSSSESEISANKSNMENTFESKPNKADVEIQETKEKKSNTSKEEAVEIPKNSDIPIEENLIISDDEELETFIDEDPKERDLQLSTNNGVENNNSSNDSETYEQLFEEFKSPAPKKKKCSNGNFSSLSPSPSPLQSDSDGNGFFENLENSTVKEKTMDFSDVDDNFFGNDSDSSCSKMNHNNNRNIDDFF